MRPLLSAPSPRPVAPPRLVVARTRERGVLIEAMAVVTTGNGSRPRSYWLAGIRQDQLGSAMARAKFWRAVRRMKPSLLDINVAPSFFDPSGGAQVIKRSLHGAARAAEVGRHFDLAANAPIGTVGMATEQAKQLQVAQFQHRISHGAPGMIDTPRSAAPACQCCSRRCGAKGSVVCSINSTAVKDAGLAPALAPNYRIPIGIRRY